MMRFGRDDRDSILAPRRRPPPNYLARGVQWKILVLLFLFMGVLALMSHARKPETWQWMWKLQGGESPADTKALPSGSSSTSQQGTASNHAWPQTRLPTDVDTRPPRPGAGERSSAEPLVSGGTSISVQADGGSEPQDDNVKMAQLDGWDHVLRQLAESQRKLLRRGLWRQRHDQRLTGNEQADWRELMGRLRQFWDAYHTRAWASVAQDEGLLTDAQKRLSMEIIQASKTIWEQRSAALSAVGESQPLTDEQAAQVSDLQRQFDQRALAQIEDNTPLRSADSEAWDRCWEKLQALSPAALSRAEGPLSFVQLFSQPAEYRGRLVRVTGTVRWGYRVDAQEQRFGTSGYIVLGILPGHGTSSPMVVYCVELPPGFPEIRRGESAERGSQLDEDVEVTGFFFKRWLHSSAGGANLSPLILGRITQWAPHPASLRNAPAARISAWTAAVAVMAMALLGTGIATWVYRSSRWSKPAAASVARPPTTLPSFDQTQVQRGVVDTLREMARAEDDAST